MDDELFISSLSEDEFSDLIEALEQYAQTNAEEEKNNAKCK